MSFREVKPDLFEDGLDPSPKSLFNVDTMRKLCKLGAEVPNILRDPEQTFN